MYGLEGRKGHRDRRCSRHWASDRRAPVSEGCRVGIFDRDSAAAHATAAAIAERRSRVCIATGNIAPTAEVETGMASLTTELGSVDILVNNAGILCSGKLLEISESDWSETVPRERRWAVPRHARSRARHGGAALRRRREHRLLDGQVRRGPAWRLCASKFAIVALTQTLATEVGEHGVRVNAVAPGLIVGTPMRDEAEIDCRAKGLELAESRAKSIPLRRAGTPEDVANTVAFLCSDQASYITGEAVSITGGLWND
jgi:NAD(P)-dependent dehydrogenase (short-subunit alcohol dehydrogenase family)